MPYRVFVSYSTKDMRVVDRVASALRASNVEVFVAEHAVLPGESLSQKILGWIAQCDLFLTMWSSSAKESEWVQHEIGAALGQGKLIIPVVLDPKARLPELLAGVKYLRADQDPVKAFRELQAIVFANAAKKRQGENLALLGLGALIIYALAGGGRGR